MLSNVSAWQLLIILVIFMLLFGTKRIKQAGSDFGGMIKGFRTEMKDVDTLDVAKDVNKLRKTAKQAKKLFKK